MIINRAWAMPDRHTFSIPPIKKLIQRYTDLCRGRTIIDPFANTSTFGTVTNDIDPEYNTTYHLEALEFLKMFADNSVTLVLYDPPYLARQVSECYKKFNLTVNAKTTSAKYWSDQKNEIARITEPGGYCISCGWNSNGIGMKRGFSITEILLVAHGGPHNDTIVTVEQKISTAKTAEISDTADAADALNILNSTASA